MAKISGNVWDVMAFELKETEKKVPGIFDKATKKAAEIYVEETKKAIRRMNIYQSGALSASIKHGKVKRVPGGRICDVWPQGMRYDKRHPRGERNETIGYVNIHGRKYTYKKTSVRLRTATGRYTAKNWYPGRDYQAEADNQAGPKVVKEVEEMLSEVFKE